MTAPFGPEPSPKRVYDAEQVDAYITDLQNELEALRTAPPPEIAPGDAAWRTAETALGRAMITAQRAADEAIEEAHSRAQTIVGEAEERARQIVADAERYADQIRQAPPPQTYPPPSFPPPAYPPPGYTNGGGVAPRQPTERLAEFDPSR